MSRLIAYSFIALTVLALIKPWEHELIDIIDRDGLLVEVDIRPQILIGFARTDWMPNYKELTISIPFFEFYIHWGSHIKKGAPRG
jgi:hypothetical protein